MAVRRPGCVLCRAQAQRLWAAREQFEAAGYKVVCIVHEWIEREVKAFTPEYWAGPVYLDTTKQLYKLLHGGEVRKGSLAAFLNPFSQAWKNVRAAKKEVKDSNMVGDGVTMGGMIAIAKGGAGVELFPELEFGEYPPMEKVLATCRKLAGAA